MVGISVIMPVYNVSSYLDTSIRSIMEQTFKDIEIICVNDGSTDDSLDVLLEIQESYDNILIINQENSGPGIARDTGIEYAEGEYIAFLDSDDIFLDTFALEKMYETAKQYDANMVSANLKWINPDYSINDYYDFINTKFTYFYREDIISPEKYGIPFAFYKNVYKRSFLLEHNITFPDIIAGEDPIFMANVLVNLKEFPTIPIDLYGYNHSIGGGVNEKINTYDRKYDYIKHFKDSFDILKNNEKIAIYSVYKIEFINYLIYSNNMQDKEIREIIREIFGDFEDYFNPDEYGYFIMDYIINNKVDETDLSEEYSKIKKSFFEESCFENNFIDTSILRDYINIKSKRYASDNFSYDKISYNELNNIKSFILENHEVYEDDVKSMNISLTSDIYDKNAEYLRKFTESRIDIKNNGKEDNRIVLMDCDDDLCHIFEPKWLQNEEGIGTILNSVKGKINFSFRCIGDGEVEISFKGIDYRDKEDNRVPIYIDFKKISIDGKVIVNDSRVVWHDNPVVYNKEVSDGQVIRISAEWLPLNEDSYLVTVSQEDELLQALAKFKLATGKDLIYTDEDIKQISPTGGLNDSVDRETLINLLNEFSTLNDENEHLKELKNSLLNSNSWKLTKPLRILKHFGK